LKEEAKTLGITYDELKKKKKRETAALESTEHKEESKRMRKWSEDLTDTNGKSSGAVDDGPASKRRRTRSMDAAEEKKIELANQKQKTPDEWRKEHNIVLKSHSTKTTISSLPLPYISFEDTPFNDTILRSFQKEGFEKPTAIQGQSWPIALKGHDTICIAKTGSGKTCGFLLPCFHQHLQKIDLATHQCC